MPGGAGIGGEEALRRLARAWDTEKDAANAMAHGICKVLSWRDEVGADPGPNARLLSPTGPAFAHGKDKALAKLWPSHVCGRDNHGHPVMYERLGAINFKELRKSYTIADILTHRGACHETMQRLRRRAARESGHVLYQNILVMDVAALGVGMLSHKKFVAPIFAQGTDLFPETLYRMYLARPRFRRAIFTHWS